MSSLKKEFSERNVDLRVFSSDVFLKKARPCVQSESSRDAKKHKMLEDIAKRSCIFTWLLLRRRYFSNSERIVNYYNNLPNEEKGDIIAFQEFYTCYTYLKQGENKQKVLVTLHNDGNVWPMLYDRYPRLKSHYFDGFKKKVFEVLKRSDKIGFVSEHSRLNFCKLNPDYPTAQTFFVYNGVMDKRLDKEQSCTDDIITFVCVGTLCERKNQIGILRAINLLSKDLQKKIRLVLVGDGPSREEIENYSSQLVSDILLVGSSNRVDDYLAMSDCFILFSKVEGLPISIIEGMRAKLPIIGTRVAGIPEQIIDGKSGYIVEVDEHKLADILKKVVSNGREQLREMGERSYDLFKEKFTIEAMLGGYVSLYKSV
jgi:glycosyltransferase involved in cell wall biosynthesis